MAIFNEEYIQEFLFKKKKYKNINKSTKKIKPIPFTLNDYNLIISKLKDILNRVNKDKNIIDKINMEIHKAINENNYDETDYDKFHKFIIDKTEFPFTDGDIEIIIPISSGGQDYNIIVGTVISDIGEELEKILKTDIPCSINSGDGDEGCLYFIKSK